MPKIKEQQDATVAPLFLNWFYFYNVTFEKPVSLGDFMFTHLSTTPGAHWVSMVLISGNSSKLVVAGGSGCRQAQVQNT